VTLAHAFNGRDLDECRRNAVRQQIIAKRHYFAAKRGIDCFAASTFLVFLALPMLLIAALVKVTSPGPVFYRTRRYGFEGRAFMMIKFRSMRIASVEEETLFKAQVSKSGVLAKSDEDPRVTAFGRWIRRTSIDELPQLLNIVLGHMSLVGPRPIMPEMLQVYPVFTVVREMVRPGLTGLWQVRERTNDTHVKFMWHHDLEYLERVSFAVDMGILIRTASMLLRARNGR
jgi:lipopolysaccharide/colanic/teichoic acid biosynthesis glycosyltransferase